jgi:hypothetical protein
MRLGALIFAGSLAWGAAATAAPLVYHGTFDSTGTGFFEQYRPFPGSPRAREYIYSWNSDAPTLSGTVTHTIEWHFDYYLNDPGHTPDYGDEVETPYDYFVPPGVTSFVNGFTFEKDFATYFPNGRLESTNVFSLLAITANVYVDPAFAGHAFSFTLTPVWVPEPGTWALMLIGTGAIGGLLRRQRSRAGTAAA